jgi:hypothetical protein
MPYQVFYLERAANEQSDENPRKEHYGTKDQALGRVRSLFKDQRHHSILLAHGTDYVLSGFRLEFELDSGGQANDVST